MAGSSGQLEEGDEMHSIFYFFIFNFFNWTDMWGPVQLSKRIFIFATSALIGGSHLSDSVSILCQCQFSANCK
jgi:hypothetical protein